RLSHPNIVQVYEVGEHDGLPYIALEYCAGGSLAVRLGGTPLPPREAAGLTEVLGGALQHAHERGGVHRDLKPAHILLQGERAKEKGPREEGGGSSLGPWPFALVTPKITDFGLAKRLDDAGQTFTGELLGTPSYAAPEQADGRARDVGPRSDVYSLCSIL